MSGQLLEDDSGVYHEGTALHGYLGYREGLLPAHQGPNKSFMESVTFWCSGEGSPQGSEPDESAVYLHDFFPMCKTLHRDNLTAEVPGAWH